ncbi:MAG: acetolactate synthase small subunit [Ruminococcus sp.]|jgi:acetolactate synthase-1/3 small subunit|nr:acetolactate synthase small subunit [Ruminococcus sp.]
MKRIYSVLVENRSGVLSRIAGLFSRRGFNIESLAVGVTETDDLSRMTIVTDDETDSPERTFEQIRKQLSKMIDTVRVKALSPIECISRELVLMKLRGDAERIAAVCEKTGARVIEETAETITIEIIAADVNVIIKAFEEFEIVETVRTGVISLQKGSSTLM